MLSHDAQRHFAQRCQVALAEKILRGPFCAFTEINFSVSQPRQQLFWRQIDKNDLVGQIENRIGNSFTDRRACDLTNRVAATADVLNVERGVNIDARIQQLEHILITFWMMRTRRVRVREFINNRKSGMPGENRIQIHFSQRRAAIFNLHTRHDWHSFEQCLRFFAPMRFDNANYDFASLGLLFTRG